MTTYAFDLDGTLLRYKGGEGFSPDVARAKAQPVRERVEHVRSLIQSGHSIHIVTGRTGMAFYKLTVEQVRQYLGADFPTRNIHSVYEHETWQGDDHLVQWKANILRSINAQSFVGDTMTDQKAAELAGIPFEMVSP